MMSWHSLIMSNGKSLPNTQARQENAIPANPVLPLNVLSLIRDKNELLSGQRQLITVTDPRFEANWIGPLKAENQQARQNNQAVARGISETNANSIFFDMYSLSFPDIYRNPSLIKSDLVPGWL